MGDFPTMVINHLHPLGWSSTPSKFKIPKITAIFWSRRNPSPEASIILGIHLRFSSVFTPFLVHCPSPTWRIIPVDPNVWLVTMARIIPVDGSVVRITPFTSQPHCFYPPQQIGFPFRKWPENDHQIQSSTTGRLSPPGAILHHLIAIDRGIEDASPGGLSNVATSASIGTRF